MHLLNKTSVGFTMTDEENAGATGPEPREKNMMLVAPLMDVKSLALILARYMTQEE